MRNDILAATRSEAGAEGLDRAVVSVVDTQTSPGHRIQRFSRQGPTMAHATSEAGLCGNGGTVTNSSEGKSATPTPRSTRLADSSCYTMAALTRPSHAATSHTAGRYSFAATADASYGSILPPGLTRTSRARPTTVGALECPSRPRGGQSIRSHNEHGRYPGPHHTTPRSPASSCSQHHLHRFPRNWGWDEQQTASKLRQTKGWVARQRIRGKADAAPVA
jgi:hypothetical protein